MPSDRLLYTARYLLRRENGDDCIMAAVFDRSFLSNRVRCIEEWHEESNRTFRRCDRTTYIYLGLSLVLFTVGTAFTIFAFGGIPEGHVLLNLGHVWLVGPAVICSGLMFATKCMVYLRRKSSIELHRQRIIRSRLQDLYCSPDTSSRVTSTVTPGPPAYEVIAQGSCPNPNEVPPPSYTEAIALLHRSNINDEIQTGAVSCGTIEADENVRRKP